MEFGFDLEAGKNLEQLRLKVHRYDVKILVTPFATARLLRHFWFFLGDSRSYETLIGFVDHLCLSKIEYGDAYSAD